MNERKFTTTGSFRVEEHVDLDQCHRDPIHETALIQPHGGFIEVEMPSLRIRSVSENIGAHLPEDASRVVGKRIETLFDRDTTSRIRDRLERMETRHDRFILDSSSGERGVTLFLAGEHRGIEVESLPAGDVPAEDLITSTHNIISRLRDIDEKKELFEHAVQALRAVTGYDRVMLYQFDEQGNGAVVSEDKRDNLRSYLGQHFPSSDIPEPARRLYRKNYIRYIPRVNYDPVPILGPEGTREKGELDLTYSTLRNVPLVHREYLRNMDVEASLSLSILVEGELWGLIACHATSPTYLAWARRNVCTLLGHAVSQQIGRLNADRRDRRHRRIERFHRDFSDTWQTYDDLFGALKQNRDSILSLMNADSFYIQVGDHCSWLVSEGVEQPPEEILDLIQDRLKASELVHVQSITDRMDETWQHSSTVSGVLAVRMGGSPRSFCAWFRPEQRQTIRWGGDPRRPVHVDDEGRLSPRASFEEWTQIVSEQCRRWTDLDVLTARELLRIFEEGALEIQTHQLQEINRELESQNRALRETREELRQVNEMKDTLMQELHHRVKNNFQLSASLVGLQKNRTEDEETRQLLDNVRSRLKSMAALHRTLYQGEKVNEVQMAPYLEEIVNTVEETYRRKEHPVSIRTSIDDVLLPSDKALLCGLILSELLTNSFEHGLADPPEGTISIQFRKEKGGIRLVVEDNGTGWDPEEDPFETDSLGLQIVQSLAEDQLGGSVQAEGSGGARFEIRFAEKS